MKQRRLMGLLAASALVVAGGTTVVLGWPADAPSASARFYDPPVAAEPPGDAEPVAEVDTAGAGTTPVVAAKAAKPAKAKSRPVSLAPAARKAARTELPEKATEPFSMLSITWTDPKDRPTGAVEVRTRSARNGKWSGWQALETNESQAPEGAEARGIRGGTGAIWVGESDAVAARVQNASGSEPLPEGLQLNLIDPGKPAAAKPAKKSATGGQGGAAVDFPAYRTRAQWGADESLVQNRPEYATAVRVQFVHHTAGSNTYNCADSAGIVRGIMIDQIRNRGFNDLGYNFMVDKCGTLFEGRKGGVDRPVLGAHTYGFNTNSSSIAVLGNFMTQAVPEVVKTVIARVAGAKLGQHTLSPVGTSQLTLGANDNNMYPGREGDVFTFQRISAHRDGVRTECPGDLLYAQLGNIRTLAGGSDGSLVLRAPAGGVAYQGSYYVKDTVTMNWATSTPAADLTGFDLLVDGKVAGSVGPDARSAPVKLTLGTRKVQVRSKRTDGSSATTPATAVVADNQAPVFNPGANLVMRTGTVAATALPVTLTWKVADNTKLGSVRMTAPSTVAFGATATSYATTARPGAARTWTMQAADVPGNVSRSSVVRTPALLAESAAARTGTWSVAANGNYLNGKSYYTATKGSKLTWTFTGRTAGVIVDRTKTSGTFDIYIDGVRKASINTKTTGTVYRQLMWTGNLAAGRHTVQIVKTGTAGVWIEDLATLS